MDTVEFEEFTVEEGLHITINLKDFKVYYPHYSCNMLTQHAN